MCPVDPCYLLRPGRGLGLKMFPILHSNRNGSLTLVRSWWCLASFRTPAKREYLIYPVKRQLYYAHWKSIYKSYDLALFLSEVQDRIWPMKKGPLSALISPSLYLPTHPPLLLSLSSIWSEKLTAKPWLVIGLYICLARLIPGFTALILTCSSVSMNLSRWCDKAANSFSKQN